MNNAYSTMGSIGTLAAAGVAQTIAEAGERRAARAEESENEALRRQVFEMQERVRVLNSALDSYETATSQYRTRIGELKDKLASVSDALTRQSSQKIALIATANELILEMHRLVEPDQLEQVDWNAMVSKFRKTESDFLEGKEPSEENTKLLLVEPLAPAVALRARKTRTGAMD